MSEKSRDEIGDNPKIIPGWKIKGQVTQFDQIPQQQLEEIVKFCCTKEEHYINRYNYFEAKRIEAVAEVRRRKLDIKEIVPEFLE